MLDFFIPLLICVLLVLPASALATKVGLVDMPNERKRHLGATPLVGGLCILTTLLGYLIAVNVNTHILYLLLISCVIVLIGSIDDRLDLSTKIRLLVQAGSALAMIFISGNQIFQIGNLFFGQTVTFGFTASVIFTVMCTVGVINSINMIDGVDGLAGSTTLVSFMALAYIAYLGGDTQSLQILLCLCGAITGFLMFNSRAVVSRAKVFLGDAGSMLLGFLLLWFCIQLSQSDNAPLSPVVAGWIFGLPLIDTVSVMVGRILSRRSPFDAGRDHFHHLLIDNGVSINRTVIVMVSIHTAIVLTGLLFNAYSPSEPYLFWTFVIIVIAHHFITPRVVFRWKNGHIAAANNQG